MSATSPLDGRASIVVGVDGSRSSKQALVWAARQSRLTGAKLRAVLAWWTPTSYGWASATPDSLLDYETEARSTLEAAVKDALGEPGSSVELEVIAGHPARVLTELSRDASLVVVGSRGHGGFVGLLLGSVGEHLTTHAHCPVAVIRQPVDGAAA
ncbi:MAG TPA: universal stress protein [Acidimicrobiales bacterium]|nr:universal stress protein [Acidimicrobiales bacterium]